MVHTVVHAVEVFFDHLAAVDFAPLGIALGLNFLKLGVRAFAWRNIIAAAFPGSRVRTRHVLGSYIAGVGVNAVVPARGGDAVKLLLLKRRIKDSSYPALASTLVVETLFDFVVAAALLTWAFTQGVLPGANVLPNLPSVDWSWPARHPSWFLVIAAAVLLLLGIAWVVLDRKIEEFRRRVRQGFAILGDQSRYFTEVVTWQALSWGFRIASTYFFLKAFGIPATLHNALLVQVVQSLSTILPFSPGGVGTQQGLLVYILRGKASTTALLSFSVGMHIAMTAVNVLLGAIAIASMQRTLRFRRTLKEAAAQPRG